MFKLLHGDILSFCKHYHGELFHSILTDPPYHLTSIVKRFGNPGSAPAKGGVYARSSKGFMGKCYSPDTEILTENGWKSIKEIVEKQLQIHCYTLDIKTRKIRLSPIIDYQKYKFSGNLLNFIGRSLDLLVTPNHRMVIANTYKDILKFCHPDNLPKAFYMINQGIWEGEKADYITIGGEKYDSKWFMRFLGIFLGDGSVVNRKKHKHKQDFITISAKKSRKRKHIVEVCEAMNLKYSQYAKQTMIYDKTLMEYLRPLGKAHEKYIPNDLFSLSKDLLNELWIGLRETDGHWGNTMKGYYTCSKQLANDIQRLLLLIGLSGNLQEKEPKTRRIQGKTLVNIRKGYLVTVHKPNKRLWFEKIDHKNKKSRLLEISYSDSVYDITVAENHTLYTRRNGKTVWSSNSWDGGDIAFRPETWEAIGKLLYPGAFGMAFGGSRTAHRMAVAIEDAGFIIHPMIGWVYSSGFPKSTRVNRNANLFCQCDDSPQQFPLNDSQHNERNEKDKGADSQLNCSLNPCQCDAQPPLFSRDDQDIEPLQADEEERSHFSLTSIRILEGSAPLYIPYQAQYIDRLSKKDCQRHNASFLQSHRESANVKYPVWHSTFSNKGDIEASNQPLSDMDVDTKASDSQYKNNLDSDSPSVSPEGESRYHDTIKCPKCGKILKRVFDGHRYGTQALKPALEPIIVFQKPYEGRPVENIVESGAGALNIDKARIGVGNWIWGTQTDIRGGGYGSNRPSDGDILAKNIEGNPKGRWPANFLLSHSPECKITGYKEQEPYQINRFTDGAKPFGDGAGHEFESEEMAGGRVPVWECADGCPVKALNEQTGVLKSGYMNGEYTGWGTQGIYGEGQLHHQETYGDSGGASRFFYQSHWMFENQDPFIYQAKTSPSERNAGLSSIPEQLYGQSGGARQALEEGEEEYLKDHIGLNVIKKVRNPHPTLKPISLCAHLATLLLPPEEYKPRRILVPFAGTASEMIGAFQAGWDCVIGVELEREYVEIGRKRLEYWLSQDVQLSFL